MTTHTIIHFEDHGQEFLTWEIDSGGNVIDPTDLIWKDKEYRYRIENALDIKIGSHPCVSAISRNSAREFYWSKYPIDKIETIERD